jgi:hypothetical protein
MQTRVVHAAGGDPNKADETFTGGIQVDVYMHYAQLLQYTATANTLSDLGISEKWQKQAHVKHPRPTAAENSRVDSPRPHRDTTGCSSNATDKENCLLLREGDMHAFRGSESIPETLDAGTGSSDVEWGAEQGAVKTSPPLAGNAVVSGPGMQSDAGGGSGPSQGEAAQHTLSPAVHKSMHRAASAAPAVGREASTSGGDVSTSHGNDVEGPAQLWHEPPVASYPLNAEDILDVDAVINESERRHNEMMSHEAGHSCSTWDGCGPECTLADSTSKPACAAAQVQRSQLYDIAGFLRSQLWLGCYRGPPPLGADLFVIISMYHINWRITDTEERCRIPVLATGLLATSTATMHEALPGCMWMGELSLEGCVGRARLEAQDCLGIHACSDETAEGPDEMHGKRSSGYGRWVHLREWFEEVRRLCAGKMQQLGADFVLIRSHGETVLGRAAAELWLSHNDSSFFCLA